MLALLVALLAVQVGRPATAGAAGVGPTAVDDTLQTSTGTSGLLAGATNDHAGATAIEPGLTVFPAAGQPVGSTLSDGGRTIQVADHGTFTVDVRDGSVSFTAWTKHTGTVSVRYRIADADGTTAEGRLLVVVTAGGESDELSTYQDVDASVEVLANDTPGRDADGSPGVLDRTSVRFLPTYKQPHQEPVSADGRTLTAPRVGVFTIDARTGLLTFDPDPSYLTSHSAGVLYYQAQDATVATDGVVEHHSYSDRLFYEVFPDAPLVTDDSIGTPFGASVTLAGVTNDTDTNPRFSLAPQHATFLPAPRDLPHGAYLSTDRRKIRFPGRGTFTIKADGSVLYVPPRGFVGLDSVFMTVVDDHGNSAQETLEVTVRPGPTAAPDTLTTAQDASASVLVLANDTPGRSGNGGRGVLDATFVRFPVDGQSAGATVSNYLRTLTVPRQGTYTADRATGAITFEPDSQFVGTASPVTYSARDAVTRVAGQAGGTVHNPLSSTLTVTVTPSRSGRAH
ncbi:MAG TPA: Ig-like domain-containing protein [Friedmanniella sp.]